MKLISNCEVTFVKLKNTMLPYNHQYSHLMVEVSVYPYTAVLFNAFICNLISDLKLRHHLSRAIGASMECGITSYIGTKNRAKKKTEATSVKLYTTTRMLIGCYMMLPTRFTFLCIQFIVVRSHITKYMYTYLD